ncbi:MAG TPA: O-antigen ligase family protein, partial [Thermoleophilaceae bacterium]|nr:O-antigen ligase family protein [Thermoleophilaceae bacterium]
MAATTTRRPAPATRRWPGWMRSYRDDGGSPSAALLGVALAIAVIYAAFANGSIGIPEESRLQVAVALLSLATLAGLLYGSGLRVNASPAAGWGVLALVGFAGWAALSITWSVAPDESWLEANRALAYALVAGLGVVLGSSLPRAAERVGLAVLAIATLIAAYALGGKLFPWLEIPGVIDLNHTDRFSRLRAPLDYWNALGLVCVVAVPLAMRAVTELRYRALARMGAAMALVVLLTTLALTYSRGGLLVLVAAVALVIGLGPERLRLGAALAAGIAGSVPPVLTVFLSDDLTTDGLSVSARTGDGLILTLTLALGLGLAALIARGIVAAGEELRLSPAGARRARRGALAAVGVALVVVLGALAVSDRGVGGTISHQADEFTKPKLDRQNDPARVLRTNSGNRWVWWEEAMRGFADRPVTGFGAGSFPITHRRYRENTIEVLQPHSVPLEFLTETGLVGALLALGGLGLLGLAALRGVRARAPGPEKAFACALLAGVFAWSLHIWVDWDWEIPGVTLGVLIALGVLAAAPPTGGPPAMVRERRERGPALALGAAALFAVAASAALPAVSQSLTSAALSDAARNTAADLASGERKAALAKRLNPLSAEPLFVQASIAERGNQPRKAARLFVDAVDLQP